MHAAHVHGVNDGPGGVHVRQRRRRGVQLVGQLDGRVLEGGTVSPQRRDLRLQRRHTLRGRRLPAVRRVQRLLQLLDGRVGGGSQVRQLRRVAGFEGARQRAGLH